MATVTAEEAQQELRRRIRMYFFKIVGCLLATFLSPFLIGGLLKAAGVEKAGAYAGIIATVGMLGTVAYAWYLVFTTWRCPSCNANVYWLVSWNMSAFAGMYGKKNCPQCDLQLISPRRGKFIYILVAIGVVFGVLGALMAAGASAQKRNDKQHQSQPAPDPDPNAPPVPNTPAPPPIPPG